MKKSLLAVAVAAALPAFAQAQSSVTLFGLLDTAVEWSNDDANTSFTAAGALAPGESTVRLINGGHVGSRFGVRGSEDLGGGLRAIFTIEHRLNIDTGAQSLASSFWNGQAWVGLAGGWGQLTAGRQYTPIFWALIPADFAGYGYYNNWAGTTAGSAAQLGSIAGVGPQGPVRLDNSLAYKSPTFGGLTVYAIYSFGELISEAPTNGFGGASGDVYGVSASWQLGGLYIGGGYHAVDTDAVSNAVATNGLEDVAAVTVSYKFTNFGLSVGYTQVNFVGGAEVTTILGSAFVGIGSGRLLANVQSIDTSGFAGFRNDSGLQWGLAYEQQMSKRTKWYVQVGGNDYSGFQPAAVTRELDGAIRASVGIQHLF